MDLCQLVCVLSNYKIESLCSKTLTPKGQAVGCDSGYIIYARRVCGIRISSPTFVSWCHNDAIILI